ncbi:cytochrome P450 [Apodospora peruviana]|uniref:Cytochrome P450 n=1 Tax=Apodospora peruviana TaxID=516989 RepID=A0AAE0LZ68_9PEZI|nr:cytochrome P450 [Apodospora peruviana]
MPSLWLPVLLATLGALLFLKLGNVGQRPKGYPPGPATRPIVGNIPDIPKHNAHIQFKKWAEEYGPIYSLIVGTKTMIMLNTDQSVKDLLDKRSNIYSSRPELFVSNLIGEDRIINMPYGDKWRMVRRLFHNLLTMKASKSYEPYQDLESKAMLAAVLDEPHLLFDHIRRYTNSLSTQIMLGFRTIKPNDPRLLRLYEGLEKWSSVTGAQSAALLDVFPAFRLLPTFMVPLYNYALEVREFVSSFFMSHWLEAKKKVEDGTAKPSFAVGLVKAQQTEQGLSDALAAWACGVGLEAGSDTTAASLIGFIQAMLLYPDAQKEAQETVDRVCGDRLPTIRDMDNLDAQYIRACAKEALRWMPTVIIGFPHSVVREDEYMGYKIPKGATIVHNTWAIHTNPTRYPNPEKFDPSRYMSDSQTSAEAAANPDVTQRDHFGFGAGRRVCPGMHVVDRSMFLAIARFMWAFTFSKAVDAATGEEITPDPADLTPGLLVQPRPFPFKVTPRSELRARVVRETWKECEELLDDEKQWKEIPKGMVFTSYSNSEGKGR